MEPTDQFFEIPDPRTWWINAISPSNLVTSYTSLSAKKKGYIKCLLESSSEISKHTGYILGFVRFECGKKVKGDIATKPVEEKVKLAFCFQGPSQMLIPPPGGD